MSERQGKFKNNQSKYMKSRAKDGSMRWKLRNQFRMQPGEGPTREDRKEFTQFVKEGAEDVTSEMLAITPKMSRKRSIGLGLSLAGGPLSGIIATKTMSNKHGTDADRLYEKPEWARNQEKRGIKYGTAGAVIGTGLGAAFGKYVGGGTTADMVANGLVLGGAAGTSLAISGSGRGTGNAVLSDLMIGDFVERSIKEGRRLGLSDKDIGRGLGVPEKDVTNHKDFMRNKMIAHGRRSIATGEGRKLKDVSDEEALSYIADYQRKLKKNGMIDKTRSFSAVGEGEFKKNTSRYKLSRAKDGSRRWMRRQRDEAIASKKRRAIAGAGSLGAVAALTPVHNMWKKRAVAGVSADIEKDLSEYLYGGGKKSFDKQYVKGMAKRYGRSILGRNPDVKAMQLTDGINKYISSRPSDDVFYRLNQTAKGDTTGSLASSAGRIAVKVPFSGLGSLHSAGLTAAYGGIDNKLRGNVYDRAIRKTRDKQTRLALIKAKEDDLKSDNLAQLGSSVLSKGVHQSLKNGLQSAILEDRLAFKGQLKNMIDDGASMVSKTISSPEDTSALRYNRNLIRNMDAFSRAVNPGIGRQAAAMVQDGSMTEDRLNEMIEQLGKKTNLRSEFAASMRKGFRQAANNYRARQPLDPDLVGVVDRDGNPISLRRSKDSRSAKLMDRLADALEDKRLPKSWTGEGGARVLAEEIAERSAMTGGRTTLRDIRNGLVSYGRNKKAIRMIAETEGVDSMLRGRAGIKAIAPLVAGTAVGVGGYEYLSRNKKRGSPEDNIARVVEAVRERKRKAEYRKEARAAARAAARARRSS